MKLFYLAAFLVISHAAPSQRSGEGFNLTILHTNDIHSHFLQSDKRGGNCTEEKAGNKSCFGGVARILTKVREIKERDKNTLFFNAGDFYQGTVWYTVLKYNIVSVAMENMMYDAVCLGNHEFDDGPEGLYPFLVRMKKANVTVLGTNLETKNETALHDIEIVKSKVYTYNGVKMGVMGVVTTETLTIAKPGKIEILDEIESIKQEIKNLKEHDVKIFAVISHVGYEKDQEIAREVEDLHFIVGGHTNTFLYNVSSPGDKGPGGETPVGDYPTVVKRDDETIALVTQDYWFGKYLGYLELQFDSDGKLKAWSGNPILMDFDIAEDECMLERLKPYEEEVRKAGEEYIGISKVELEADNKTCRLKECNMVNLIADSFLAYYADRNSTIPEDWSDVNAAVINAGITRASIQQGIIRRRDIMAAMPFESSLVVLTMTGTQLKTMFNHGISKFTWYNDPEGSFLQVSGMRVVYDFTKPNTSRTETLEILCAKCSIPRYESVVSNKTYRIVTTSFIANGGDGFTFDTDVKKTMKTEGRMDVEVFTEYVRKMSPIKTPEEGRVIMLNNSRPDGSDSGGLYPNSLRI
uniref:5'-nucleotidase n=1 Tax=Ixodes ricinus TaxID=34613 RepID=A0A6B0VCU7_IXORI